MLIFLIFTKPYHRGLPIVQIVDLVVRCITEACRRYIAKCGFAFHLRHAVGKTRIAYQLSRIVTGLPRTVMSNTQHELYKDGARHLMQNTISRNQIPSQSSQSTRTRHFYQNANCNHTHAREQPAQAFPFEKFVRAINWNGTKHFAPPRTRPSRCRLQRCLTWLHSLRSPDFPRYRPSHLQ